MLCQLLATLLLITILKGSLAFPSVYRLEGNLHEVNSQANNRHHLRKGIGSLQKGSVLKKPESAEGDGDENEILNCNGGLWQVPTGIFDCCGEQVFKLGEEECIRRSGKLLVSRIPLSRMAQLVSSSDLQPEVKTFHCKDNIYVVPGNQAKILGNFNRKTIC